jgi:hypothetical protein
VNPCRHWSKTPYHAYNHLWLVWQRLTPKQRKECWEWQP